MCLSFCSPMKAKRVYLVNKYLFFGMLSTPSGNYRFNFKLFCFINPKHVMFCNSGPPLGGFRKKNFTIIISLYIEGGEDQFVRFRYYDHFQFIQTGVVYMRHLDFTASRHTFTMLGLMKQTGDAYLQQCSTCGLLRMSNELCPVHVESFNSFCSLWYCPNCRISRTRYH